MYKRLCLLPWVPILTSCGFGTQVSIVDCDVLCTQSNLWFWDSGSEPISMTCATTPSRVETLLYSPPFIACSRRLLSAWRISNHQKSHSAVVGVVRPHSRFELGWTLGDHCRHRLSIAPQSHPQNFREFYQAVQQLYKLLCLVVCNCRSTQPWAMPIQDKSAGFVCDDLSHGTFFLDFLDFCITCTFSKSKGQVISCVMCHMQVMWWIMGLVMWWVRWYVMWWLTHASHALTGWLSCWLSAKPWWLTAEDAVPNCGLTY
jgi:hypothetical protein